MKTKLFSFLALIVTMLFTTSCETEETIYNRFTISVTSGDVCILDDVSTYVSEQVSALQSGNLSGNMTESEATSITKTFMNNLVSNISAQEYRVFEGSTLTATVNNMYNEEIYTYTVTLTAYGDVASYYSFIIIEEITPNNSYTDSDIFISSLMTGYTFDYSQVEYPGNANFVINAYSYRKYFSTFSDAQTDYNECTFTDYFIDEVIDNWPSDVVYSGKFTVYIGYKEEISGYTKITNSSSFITSPSWMDNKTWSSSNQDAPFAKLNILSAEFLNAPYYMRYSISLDNDSSAGLYLIQAGYALLIVDSSYNVQYTFKLSDTSSFQLVSSGDDTIENGAVYTK